MASNEWCLTDNDSDEERANDEIAPADSLELGGFTIPPWRVLQLMQVTDIVNDHIIDLKRHELLSGF